MRIWIKLFKFILILVIVYYALFFICVYKDVVLSLPFKKNLKGKIVYSVKGHYINLLNLDTGKKTTIYKVPFETLSRLGFVSDPSFSPDGKQIVFSQSQRPFDDSLYIMDADGANIKELLISKRKDSYECPFWAPDGERIAFIKQKTNEQGVYSINLRNRDVKRITNVFPEKDQPSWSPDGQMIAFTYENKIRRYIAPDISEEWNRSGIYIIDADTGQIRKHIELASQPTWSPCGRLLAYEGMDGYYVTGIYDNFVYDDTLVINYNRPFFGIGRSYPVRWSPDGKFLVFHKEIWPGLAGVYAISLDNPNQHIRIDTDDDGIIGMSWAR